jgi:hypothetical protein
MAMDFVAFFDDSPTDGRGGSGTNIAKDPMRGDFDLGVPTCLGVEQRVRLDDASRSQESKDARCRLISMVHFRGLQPLHNTGTAA